MQHREKIYPICGFIFYLVTALGTGFLRHARDSARSQATTPRVYPQSKPARLTQGAANALARQPNHSFFNAPVAGNIGSSNKNAQTTRPNFR